MFGSFLGGTTISGIDPEEERQPQERPTRIVFPQVEANPVARWSDAHPPPDFQKLFASIQRHEAILSGHIEALNCHHQASPSADALLPPRDDGTSYLTPTADKEKILGDRIAEIDITNDAAFRSLSKTTKPGEKAPRLAHMRKFWLGLDNMAQFWDTTADQYYYREVPVRPIPSQCNVILQEKEFYKGRRTGSGREMPDAYRVDTVRAFVEGITSAFNCRVSRPYVAQGRSAAMLQINKLEQPVRLTGVVMRLPADQTKARSGILEGPVMGVFESNCIDFGSKTEYPKKNSELHLLSEMAALLFLAQQRRRQGQTATKPGEGAWYTTKPRWGGGAGYQLAKLQQAEDDHREILARLAKVKSMTNSNRNEERDARRELQGQQSAAKKWATMKGSSGSWDPKTEYRAIGKSPESPYDEIFLVSCLFHHVSILKLTVHGAYTDFLTTGTRPAQFPLEEDWSIPKVERTVWYDLFEQEQRTQAFKCVWGVMEYLCRDVGRGENADVATPAVATAASANGVGQGMQN